MIEDNVNTKTLTNEISMIHKIATSSIWSSFTNMKIMHNTKVIIPSSNLKIDTNMEVWKFTTYCVIIHWVNKNGLHGFGWSSSLHLELFHPQVEAIGLLSVICRFENNLFFLIVNFYILVLYILKVTTSNTSHFNWIHIIKRIFKNQFTYLLKVKQSN